MPEQLPLSWGNVPIIGKNKNPAPAAQEAPAKPSFFGVEIPEGFLKDWGGVMRIIAMTNIGPREFYSEAPMVFEGSLTTIIQAFEMVPGDPQKGAKNEIVKYKLLVFANTPVQSYAVKNPDWWESRKGAELAE